MAIGWLTVLQNVPWSDVVRNAPKVAAGAKKLWGSVGNKEAVDHAADLQAQSSQPPEPVTLGYLQAQIATLQAVVSDLRHRSSESSALITALAEQNGQLIQRVATLRKRTLRLAFGLILVGFAAGAALWLSLR